MNHACTSEIGWFHWTSLCCGLWQLFLIHLAVELSPQHAHVSKLKSICTCIVALTHPRLTQAAAHAQWIRARTVIISGDGHFFNRPDGNLATPANATPLIRLCGGCGLSLPSPCPSLPPKPGPVQDETFSVNLRSLAWFNKIWCTRQHVNIYIPLSEVLWAVHLCGHVGTL